MIRRRTSVQLKDYLIAGALALGMMWLLFLTFNIARKEEIARHAALDTHAQLLTLQAREHTLEANIHDLSTARGQEATLRQTYGVAKPGEEVIIVVPSAASTTTPPKSWWQKTLDGIEFWKKK